MRRWVSFFALSFCALPFLTDGCSAQTQTPLFNLWWYSDSALATFLKTSHPGVNIITPGNYSDSNAPTIKSQKYTLMAGLGGYAAQYAQGSASLLSYIEGVINSDVAEGAAMIYVNEPDPAPGQSTATSAASIAYNVKGFNILYSYIHTKWPNVMFGLSIGGDGKEPLHVTMLKAGLHEDFAQVEQYNGGVSHPFAGWPYPSIKRSILTYNTQTLCEGNGTGLTLNDTDIWAFWDVDNFGGWIGPFMDASWLANVETFASTKTRPFCTLPVSYVDPKYWTWNTKTANFTVKVDDTFYVLPAQYTIASCDYEVVSGANAVNGPASGTVTLPWTTRACNGNITITVGAGGNCRNNGKSTCLVFTRAHTTTGALGNVTYQEYTIGY